MKQHADEIQTLVEIFRDREPFRAGNFQLRSLTTGLVAEKSVNVDSAESVENVILDSMVGVSVANHRFTKKNQLNTLATTVYVSVTGATVETDPKMLYQLQLVAGIGAI